MASLLRNFRVRRFREFRMISPLRTCLRSTPGRCGRRGWLAAAEVSCGRRRYEELSQPGIWAALDGSPVVGQLLCQLKREVVFGLLSRHRAVGFGRFSFDGRPSG